MPIPTLEACFYIEEPAEFEYRDGLFHIIQTIGDMRFERVMRPRTLLKTFSRAALVIQQYHADADDADVIPFRGGKVLDRDTA